ncbi:GNAT family N-acetyltransferase [Ferruginibacter yonginensis]|uniref:GNAT family N-acetyltransferase n=1 Tax=Ferruginibacter yonginensis TaxID=1310416 RepID=A0ABV8QN94_9BACT
MLNLNFTPFPYFETEELIFRETVETDKNILFQLRSNPEVMHYIGRPVAKNFEDVLPVYKMMIDNVANNISVPWWIVLKATNETVGQIGFHYIDIQNERAEIGYYLLPQYQNKGITTKAIKAVVAYGFEHLHFHSIEAKVDPENTASARVLQKNGFIEEGMLRQNYYYNNRFNNTQIFGILKDEWYAKNKS